MKKCTYLLLALLVLLALPVTAMAAENDVAAMIGELPTVEEFKAMDSDAQLDAYNRTQAAYDAYTALSGEEKAQIQGAEAVFEALFSHYNTLIAPAEAAEKASGSFLTETVTTVLAVAIVAALFGMRKKGLKQ